MIIDFDYVKFFFGSSRPKVFCKKVALRHFTKFTGKHIIIIVIIVIIIIITIIFIINIIIIIIILFPVN